MEYRPIQKMGLGAILSGLFAAGSILTSCSGRTLLGLILAVLAIPIGFLGAFRATSPHISGGALSIASIVMGVIGIVVAVVAMIFKIVLFPF